MHTELEKQHQALIELLKDELMDADGYPTESVEKIITAWPLENPKGWFEFIKQQWYYSTWGWKESVQDHEYRKNKRVLRYNISTAGWSGNEYIIRAMQSHSFLWHITWVQSRRGGHYIFEIPLEDE